MRVTPAEEAHAGRVWLRALSSVDEPFSLPLKPRQGTGRDALDVDFEAEAEVEVAGNAGGVGEAVFDLDLQGVHLPLADDGGPVFDDFGEGPHNLVDGAGENVDAANHEHVIRPA